MFVYSVFKYSYRPRLVSFYLGLLCTPIIPAISSFECPACKKASILILSHFCNCLLPYLFAIPCLFRIHIKSRRLLNSAAFINSVIVCPAIFFLLSAFLYTSGNFVPHSPNFAVFCKVSPASPIPHACSFPAFCAPLLSSYHHAPFHILCPVFLNSSVYFSLYPFP